MELSDEKQREGNTGGAKQGCLSFDQVVAGCGVDLSEEAVENEHQHSLLKELVERNADVFSQNPLDYSHTKMVQHEIPLVEKVALSTPISQDPPFPVAGCQKVVDCRNHPP